MKTNAKWLPAAVLCCLALILDTHRAAPQTKETPTQEGGTKIEVKVNSVLVPVLVRDAQGRAVGNLKKEDFEVFDKDKPQVISGFTIEKRAGLDIGTKAAEPAPAPVTPTVAPQPASVPERFIVFLFDDMHLAVGDLLRVQKVATKMLAGVVGRFGYGRGGFHVRDQQRVDA